MKNSNRLLLLCLLCLATAAQAQSFKLSAPLDTVLATAFYRIPITPALSAYARADNADIRIAAPDGSYIPYIVRNYRPADRPVSRQSELKLLGSMSDKKYTTVTLQQQDTAAYTFGMALIMAATSVERYAQISGSNDNAHWYIINDHILLQQADNYSKGTYAQYIQFPGSKYLYYKLKIDNAHTDPLHITAAHAFNDSVQQSAGTALISNPAPIVIQKDSSNHISYVLLRNSLPYMVSRLSLSISGPKFYERSAQVYILPSDKDSSALYSPIASIVISSAKPAVYNLPGSKASAIIIVIDNKDSPPLKLTSAATQQQDQYLVAQLEAGKSYILFTGNEQSSPPQYDLSRFNDSIPAELPTIAYGPFTNRPTTAIAPTKKETKSYWLWIIIVASVGVLSLLTYRLMKDVGRGSK